MYKVSVIVRRMIMMGSEKKESRRCGGREKERRLRMECGSGDRQPFIRTSCTRGGSTLIEFSLVSNNEPHSSIPTRHVVYGSISDRVNTTATHKRMMHHEHERRALANPSTETEIPSKLHRLSRKLGEEMAPRRGGRRNELCGL